jgi:hypothetical protein
MKCKDTMGHELNEGDWVNLIPKTDMPWIGRVVNVTDDSIVAINKNQGPPLAKVRIVFDITLTSDARIAVFPNLVKVFSPGSDELQKKLAELGETPPTPPAVQ